MAAVQIFIATYNRPDLLIRSIDSVLNQTFQDFELIISDNSPNNETQILLCERYATANLKYIHRIPSTSGVEHLNIILNSVTSDYFMIFHDDDTMHPNMLESLYKVMISRNCVAVGSNSRVVKNGKTRKKPFLNIKRNLSIFGIKEMACRFLNNNEIVPFPSYMYNHKLVKGVNLNLDKGGKYADAAFLIDISQLGEIVFWAEPLMDYYFHKGQDSFNNNFIERMLLIKYIQLVTGFSRNHILIRKYRLLNLTSEISQELLIRRDKKRIIYVLKILIVNSQIESAIKLLLRFLRIF